MTRQRVTLKDPQTGKTVRLCKTCGEVKDLETGFFKATAAPRGTAKDWDYRCRECSERHARRLEKRQRRDPILGPALRAKQAAIKREQYRRDPESHRAAVRRRLALVRKDPKLRARYLENARIAYRLRAERGGLRVRGGSVAMMGRDSLPKLPAQPLVDLLMARVDGYPSELAMCRDLGIDARQLRAWRAGEYDWIQFDVVDRVLTALGLSWFEVWSKAEYPETYERLAA